MGAFSESSAAKSAGCSGRAFFGLRGRFFGRFCRSVDCGYFCRNRFFAIGLRHFRLTAALFRLPVGFRVAVGRSCLRFRCGGLSLWFAPAFFRLGFIVGAAVLLDGLFCRCLCGLVDNAVDEVDAALFFSFLQPHFIGD